MARPPIDSPALVVRVLAEVPNPAPATEDEAPSSVVEKSRNDGRLPLPPWRPSNGPRMLEKSTRARPGVRLAKYTKTRIAVTRGPDTGARIEAAGTLVRIGTSPDCDLVLTDDTVSRRHCEIEMTEGGVHIRDSGSTNGVVISGMRVFDAVLTGKLTLKLGDTTIIVTPLSETVDREQITGERFGDLIGRSPRMRELFADLERIAPTDMTLLIEGETGTGKDLVAESVHRASPRADHPYVVFDCGAVVPALAESELFGHERGAFTGAVSARAGLFEQADKGTLFLDELGELPKDLQPKLLRALEKREIRRVGGAKTIAVDVRVIAATNRNMAEEVRRGHFREDLYFRVAATHVMVAPLRERKDDLALLVEHFLSLEHPPRVAADLPEDIWEMLRAHRWPGNVRELRNVVQRLLVTPERALSPAIVHETGSLRALFSPTPDQILPLRLARREVGDALERSYLDVVLAKTEGNVTRAAAIAEVSRQMMQRLMRKHGFGQGR
jgi:transcriptional regulator with PAS, ATPase and Fis domain